MNRTHGRIAVTLCLVCVAVGAADAVAEVGPRLGFELARPGVPAASESAAPGAPVRLAARWAAIETRPGEFDWSGLEPDVRQLARADHRITVVLRGPAPAWLREGRAPAPARPGTMEAWEGFVRAAARRIGRTIDSWEIDDWELGSVGSAQAADEYAFLLKATVLALGAEAKEAGYEARVYQSSIPLDERGYAWQQRLWDRDVAAYVEGLPARVDATRSAANVGESVRRLLQAAVRNPPAASLRVLIEAGGSGAWNAERAALAALTAGADSALVPIPQADPERTLHAGWVVAADALLADGFAPAPSGTVSFRGEDESPDPTGRIAARFFSAEGFSTLIFFELPPRDGGGSALLDVDAAPIRNARIINPADGTVLRAAASRGPSGGSRVRIAGDAVPRVLRFDRVIADGFELPPDEVTTRGTRELTVEEIVARFQQVQRAQDDRLERWSGRGRTDLHFRLAEGGPTFDLSVESNYFWQRGGDLEWEQTDFFFNGNRIRANSLPELPLIQPDKVLVAPLDLTFDKSYAYRLVGRGRVDGREAYVVEFGPDGGEEAPSLFRGRVWIDAESFVRLKTSVVQTGLEAPILSNEEVDRYTAVRGGDRDYWMLTRSDGQQVFKTVGRTFVVVRELAFESVVINPPLDEFRSRRDAAYDFRNSMIRDTKSGLRYLDRQDDGTRVVKEGQDSSQLLLGGGLLKDGATGGAQPLLAANYFDYQLGNRELQLNAFFAGVFGFVSLSDPNLGGSNVDLTLDLGLVGIQLEDRVYVGDNEQVGQRIEQRPQNLTATFGFPAGKFFKFNANTTVIRRDFFRNDEATTAILGDPMLGGFILPVKHWESAVGGEMLFNRKGYSLELAVGRSWRSDWQTWGPVDPTGQPINPEPVNKRFDYWSATLFKEWYLANFQKLRGELNYLDGNDLDRFSRYQFSFFGDDRLWGYSGSGVRFDRAAIARLGYSFNLLEAVRIDAAIDHARVEQFDMPGVGRRGFTGVGVSGSFVGPWKTLLSIQYGYAIDSAIPDIEGNQEFLLLILRFF